MRGNYAVCIRVPHRSRPPCNSVKQGLRDGTIDLHPSQWPNFIYADEHAPVGEEDVWNGLFQHPLIVKVRLYLRLTNYR
jgi:hypothetical protein